MTEIKWFDATKVVPLPKQFDKCKYSVEVISSKGDLVCYDFENQEWNRIVIKNEIVIYIPIQITEWTGRPYKELGL